MDVNRDGGRPSPTSPPTVDLRIGELVIDGFGRVDADAVAEVVERELGRLLGRAAAAGRVPRARRLAQVDPGRVRAPAGVDPEALGTRVALALYRDIVGRHPPRAPTPGSAAEAYRSHAGTDETEGLDGTDGSGPRAQETAPKQGREH